MRTIDPSYSHRQPVRPKRRWPYAAGLVAVLSLIIVGLAWWSFRPRPPAKGSTQGMVTQQAKPEEQPSQDTAPEPPPPAGPRKLKNFTGEEFKKLYNTFAYPNTQEVTTPLPITGDVTADERIRAIAIGRGYELRSVPVSTLPKVDGFPLQERAIEPWRELRKAAAAAGIDINIVSSFRSPEDQRSIFLAQMRAMGINADMIAAGQADNQVDTILRVYSVPGYSRHHTGYTLDLQCGNSGLDSFVNTPCFAWLSKNNYENAKLRGWIPSYPDNAANQGPNPEQWEYVWVGLDSVYE